MGRKVKQTTFNQRQLVIFHHEKGQTIRKIAHLLQMKRSTVSDIILRYKKRGQNRVEKTIWLLNYLHRHRRIPYYQTDKTESSHRCSDVSL